MNILKKRSSTKKIFALKPATVLSFRECNKNNFQIDLVENETRLSLHPA